MKETKYFVGVDIGGTTVKAGIVDGNNKIVLSSVIKTIKKRPIKQIVDNIIMQIKQLLNDCNLNIENIKAIGVGVPGIVDSNCGKLVFNSLGWENVNFKKLFSSAFNLPVFALNDSNAAALSEYAAFRGKTKNMVLLTIGTGIGAGIMIDGQLFSGNKFAGAEIGHMVIADGKTCPCKRVGCFEMLASARALVENTKNAMKANKQSKMWAVSENFDDINVLTAFKAAKLCDKDAQKVVNEYLENLGIGITNVANIFRPEAIVIGGGLSVVGKELIGPLQDYLNTHIYGKADYAPVKIMLAKLKNDAGIIGASLFAKQNVKL